MISQTNFVFILITFVAFSTITCSEVLHDNTGYRVRCQKEYIIGMDKQLHTTVSYGM